MTLDKLAISVEGKELALIDGMALDGGLTLTQDGKGVNSQVNYTRSTAPSCRGRIWAAANSR